MVMGTDVSLARAVEVSGQMEGYRIMVMPTVQEGGVVEIVHLHDLLPVRARA